MLIFFCVCMACIDNSILYCIDISYVFKCSFLNELRSIKIDDVHAILYQIVLILL